MFNQMNARKLSNELNIFENFFSNWIAVCVFAAEVILQVIITEFTGRVFSVNFKGLTWQQWLISMAFCAGSWVIRAILTFFDCGMLPEVGKRETTHIRSSFIRASSRINSELRPGIKAT